MYRPGQMFCLIFFLRQNLDKLRPVFNHSTYFFVPDLCWHTFSPFPGYTAAPDTKIKKAKFMPVAAFMTLLRTVAHWLWLAYFLLLHLESLPVQFRVRETK